MNKAVLPPARVTETLRSIERHLPPGHRGLPGPCLGLPRFCAPVVVLVGDLPQVEVAGLPADAGPLGDVDVTTPAGGGYKAPGGRPLFHPRVLAHRSGQPSFRAGGGVRLGRPCRLFAGPADIFPGQTRPRGTAWRRPRAPLVSRTPYGEVAEPLGPGEGAGAPAKGSTPAPAPGGGPSHLVLAEGGPGIMSPSVPLRGLASAGPTRLEVPLRLRGRPAPSLKERRGTGPGAATRWVAHLAQCGRYRPGAFAHGRVGWQAIATSAPLRPGIFHALRGLPSGSTAPMSPCLPPCPPGPAGAKAYSHGCR